MAAGAARGEARAEEKGTREAGAGGVGTEGGVGGEEGWGDDGGGRGEGEEGRSEEYA